MNKKTKKLAILLGVLVVCCGATFALSRYQAHKEAIETTDETILAVEPDTVTTLSWNYTNDDGDSFSLAFHKDDSGNWIYDDDENFPVDADKITNLLTTFQGFGAAFVISDVEDYSQYGLDDPTCEITFTADDTDYTVDLGTFSTMDQERYVSLGNDGKAYLVTTDPMDTFAVELKDMIKDDTVPSLTDATEISVAGSDEYTAAYEEENTTDTYDSSDVWFTDGKPLDTTSVSSYLSDIQSLDESNYVTYNATEEELKEYGLDDPELTVTVTYPQEDSDEESSDSTTDASDDSAAASGDGTFVMNLGRNPEDVAKEEEEAAKAEASGETEAAETTAYDSTDSSDDAEADIYAYVRIGDSQIVYGISEDDYKLLAAGSYNDLRHHEIVTASFDDVTSVDFVLEDQTYTLTASSEDDEKTWSYKDSEVDFTDLQSAIAALKVQESDDFTDEAPAEDQKEEISLTLHLDNETFPEVQVELYRCDGEYCLAVVDGETVAKIPRSQVVDLVEAVNSIVLE